MLFVIQFRDDPARRHLRPELMAAHLAFLKANESKVRVAGSLRKESDDRAIGGMWIVDVAKYGDVRELYEKDPFWVGGLTAKRRSRRESGATPDGYCCAIHASRPRRDFPYSQPFAPTVPRPLALGDPGPQLPRRLRLKAPNHA